MRNYFVFVRYFSLLCSVELDRASRNGSIADGGPDCRPGGFAASVLGAAVHRNPDVYQLYGPKYSVSTGIGDKCDLFAVSGDDL